MADSPEWFADEELWAETYDVMFTADRFATAPEEVRRILALTGVSSPARVLDLCCGPGRHSMELARSGFQVTGVDRTEFLLNKAIEQSSQEGERVEWVRSDMRDFVRPTSFDLALSLFTSFGYFPDHEDNQQVLNNLFECLVVGGSLVVDVNGKEIIARRFEPTASRDVPGGVVVERRRVHDGWSRISNEWIRIQEAGVSSFHFDVWVYSGRELDQMLSRAGFGEVALYGDLLGRPYDAEAERLVAVATK